MMWLIHGWLKRAVLWAVGAALAVFGIWTAGKRHARQKAKIEGLEGYKETRERIDDAPVASDASDARERLSKRNPKQR